MSTIDNTVKMNANAASGFFARFFQKAVRYRVYRTTVTELANLSDRELTDLAISRSEIRSIAYKAAYGG